jgi:hypothetical protein
MVKDHTQANTEPLQIAKTDERDPQETEVEPAGSTSRPASLAIPSAASAFALLILLPTLRLAAAIALPRLSAGAFAALALRAGIAIALVLLPVLVLPSALPALTLVVLLAAALPALTLVILLAAALSLILSVVCHEGSPLSTADEANRRPVHLFVPSRCRRNY